MFVCVTVRPNQAVTSKENAYTGKERKKKHSKFIYLFMTNITPLSKVRIIVPLTCLLADPFSLRKITTDPHSFAHVNMGCSYDRYPKLKLYISELTLDSYEYIVAAQVTKDCII